MSVLLVNGNALQIPLADGVVQTVATSPPYFGLRSYELGDQKHNEIGLESSVEEYVANIVAVFREVKRVLRDDGTVWLNMGDSFWGGKGQSGYELPHEAEERRTRGETFQTGHNVPGYMKMRPTDGKHPVLKPKDLCGIPWRVAFALQSDGWYLRSEITWCKVAPMPESVQDRPTSATEKIFLLSKSPRYFYDAESVRTPGQERNGQAGTFARKNGKMTEIDVPGQEHASHGEDRDDRVPGGHNLWNYWLLGPEPYSGSHYAVFPRALVEPCIKAGSSEAGCCSKCGGPWERVTAVDYELLGEIKPTEKAWNEYQGNNKATRRNGRARKIVDTIKWQPACACNAPTRPCLVLDPFCGSGTTGVVSRKLGRDFVGIDLSYSYLHDQARERLSLTALDEWENGREVETELDGLPLFGGNGGGG